MFFVYLIYMLANHLAALCPASGAALNNIPHRLENWSFLPVLKIQFHKSEKYHIDAVEFWFFKMFFECDKFCEICIRSCACIRLREWKLTDPTAVPSGMFNHYILVLWPMHLITALYAGLNEKWISSHDVKLVFCWLDWVPLQLFDLYCLLCQERASYVYSATFQNHIKSKPVMSDD